MNFWTSQIRFNQNYFSKHTFIKNILHFLTCYLLVQTFVFPCVLLVLQFFSGFQSFWVVVLVFNCFKIFTFKTLSLFQTTNFSQWSFIKLVRISVKKVAEKCSSILSSFHILGNLKGGSFLIFSRTEILGSLHIINKDEI